MKSLMLQQDQVRFNLFVPFEKSFQLTMDQPEMPDEFLSLNLDQGYYVWGYANVPSVDLQGDMFPMDTLRAMAPSLTRPPYNKIFLFHDYNDIASGTIIATAMDENGMLVLAKLNEEHSRASEVWGSVQNKTLDGFSMGGSFIQVETIEDEETGMTFNVVREAVATEVSLTSAPVNGESLIMGAFKKSKEIFNKVEDKKFNKSVKIEMKGEDKKFFINEEFMKSLKSVKPEKYIKKQNLKKGMVDEKKKLISVTITQADNGFILESYDTNVKEAFENLEDAMKSSEDLLNKEYKKEDKEGIGEKVMEKALKKEDFTDKQKEVFDKAVKDGKSEKDAMKLLSDMLDKEAIEGAESKSDDLAKNPMKTGAENTATKKKELKKSIEGEKEKEEPADEGNEPGTEDPEDNPKEPGEEGSEKGTEGEGSEGDEPGTEESEEKVKEQYEKSLKNTEELKSKLEKFKKAVPEENDDPENKPVRKSKKTEQTPEHSADNSKSTPSKTPFVDWIRGR